MIATDADAHTDTDGGRAGLRGWQWCVILVAVLCLGSGWWLHGVDAGAAAAPIRYRFGLWDREWAALLWLLGSVAGVLALAVAFSRLIGSVGREWIRWVLGPLAHLVGIAGALSMFVMGGLLGVLALVDHPTTLTADDGQKVFADLDYDGGIAKVRVRQSAFGYGFVPVRVEPAPDPADCRVRATGGELELLCPGVGVVLKGHG